MKVITFDPAKDRLNREKHGISLDLSSAFDWHTATYNPDKRKDYGEQRIIGTGFIHDRLHVMIFVVRNGIYRIISLRKANAQERKKYEKETRIH